tara:strand:- start:1187 stop:1732 length:546 start_codon:yes stop_codon:yes gene_type:complete
MPQKRNENLNTVCYWEKQKDRRKYGRKCQKKSYENHHYRGEIKIVGKETDVQECKECHRVLPIMSFTTIRLRGDGAYHLSGNCRECMVGRRTEQTKVRKNAPPKPEQCCQCHKKTEKLEVDHIHGSTTFRGWLCRACNTGLGKLGDNLEGVLQGAIYLENDTDKIIETLSKVFNEMFARTK